MGWFSGLLIGLAGFCITVYIYWKLKQARDDYYDNERDEFTNPLTCSLVAGSVLTIILIIVIDVVRQLIEKVGS